MRGMDCLWLKVKVCDSPCPFHTCREALRTVGVDDVMDFDSLDVRVAHASVSAGASPPLRPRCVILAAPDDAS